MKAANFTYHRPSTLEEAVGILAKHVDEDARILSGGQSLTPIMAFRLSRPSHVIDINSIKGLDRVGVEGGELVIGARVNHCAFEDPVEPGTLGRLLALIVRSIAHYPIRTRGTFCGSLSHADPASEWCLAAATLEAKLRLLSVRGWREIAAPEFFVSAMSTALADDEILVQARLPLLSNDIRFGFEEFSRQKGDFALAASLVCYRLADRVMSGVKIGIGGPEERPRRVTEAEACLEGREPSEEIFEEAASICARCVKPMIDPQVTSDFRRHLVRAMTRRALEQSVSRVTL